MLLWHFVPNASAITDDRCDNSKKEFLSGLKQVFDDFPTYHTKILFGYYNAYRLSGKTSDLVMRQVVCNIRV